MKDPVARRLIARYFEAADTVFMDGSTPWEVDEAMVAFGFAMGPYEQQDIIGLDVVNPYRRPAGAQRRYIPLADRMLELGKLGRKSGAGWYRYPGGAGKVDDPIVADLAIEESHFERRTRTDYSPCDIRSRLLLALINEACDLLHEGLCDTSAALDQLSLLHCGFPAARGGVMRYAQDLGFQTISQRLAALAREDPIAWAASPALRTML